MENSEGNPGYGNNTGRGSRTGRMILIGAIGAVAVGGAIVAAGYSASYKGNNPEYSFNGAIGNDQVSFYESANGQKNTLSITVPDGSVVTLTDNNDDFNIESVVIAQPGADGKTMTTSFDSSSSNPNVQQIMADGQLMFFTTLDKILDTKAAALYKVGQ